MRKNKSCMIFIFGIIVCMLFSGCASYKGYVGEHPDLFAVAINSVPNTNGYIISEIRHQPVLKLLEKDEQGRSLFCYSEAYINGEVSLVICQKSDETFSYYYMDCNFISSPLSKDNYVTIYGSKRQAEIINPLNDFTTETIEELKTKNDWGNPFNDSKCIKVEISQTKNG